MHASLGAIAATLTLAPAFASTNLLVTGPLLFVGGILLTVPVAPGEALCTDVVLPHLRGRGAMVRQVVRTASFTGPYLIGLISDQIAPNTALGLRWAIVATCPLYALGGLVMLFAARHYPRDIATVIAYSRRAGQRAPAEACAGGVVALTSVAARAEEVMEVGSAGLCAEVVVAEATGLEPVESAAPVAGMDLRAQSAPAPGSDG